jgi:carbon-monoxide dehydrogenase large subunit
MGPAWSTGSLVPNQYRLSNYRAAVSAVATNKTPNSTYRGFGAPEAVFAIERLMDKAAKRLSLDPAEIRRRNLVCVDEQPYRTVTGGVYDSGDYGVALQRALEAVDYPAVRQEQAELRRAGVRRGIGIGSYVYVSGFSPSYLFGLVGYERSGHEAVRVVIDPSGGVAVHTGMVALGQGTETVLAQATADRLGIDMTAVRVVSGDTAMTPYSDFGTVGSRINVAIVAAFRAIDDLKEKVVAVGAGLLEVAPTLCEFADGAVRVLGESSRCVPLADVAREAYLAHHVPEGFEPGLDTIRAYDPPNHTWGYGCHIAVVDVEPDTGRVTWVRYVAVGDHGTLVNPLLADGQIQGGLAQGIGGALLEQLPYDEAGQLLVSSLADYCIPTFNDMPLFEIHHLVTPSPHTEGGFKGVGEAGVIPAAAAIANAVSDALGIDMDRLPLTPNTVWNAAALTTVLAPADPEPARLVPTESEVDTSKGGPGG